MDLHHQPIFYAHARHLGQHLGAKEFLILGSRRSGKYLLENPFGLGLDKFGGLRGRMAMIGRSATQLLETLSRLSQGSQVAVPCRRVLPILLAELLMDFAEAIECRIDHRIRPESRQDAGLPS